MDGHMMKYSEPITTNEQCVIHTNHKTTQNIINKTQKLDEKMFF